MNRIDRIRDKLAHTLKPLKLEIEDESAKHAGHAGAKKGGHYRVFIVCPNFSGRPLIARHRMIYEALGEQMRHDIHALSIVARAPEEVPEVGAS